MFAPGDVVVCVDNAPDRFDPKAALLTVGRHYRVATAGVLHGNPCVGFRCLLADEPGKAWGFQARRFRKIDPASESFTEQMRACKPRRETIDA